MDLQSPHAGQPAQRVEDGGFLPPTLPSPPPSSVTSASLATPFLPLPRHHPLTSGSPKESNFIRYMDRGILGVTRRYAKRFSGVDGGERDAEMNGYEHFKEAAKDMESLIDVVWVSGTPSLQTPYLLSLALMFVTYLPSFPASPRATFHLLHKFDLAFSALLQGRSPDTGEELPGFDMGRGLNTTDKVRIRSLVQRTRVVLVDAMAQDERDDEDEPEESVDQDIADGPDVADEVENWEMEIAKAYDQTMAELGETLGNEA